MMFHGVLVTNGFLRTEKFTEHYHWLSEAAKRQGMSLEMKTNGDFFLPYPEAVEGQEEIKRYDFILYWDKDISLGRRLSALAGKYRIPVFNSLEAIELCDDKIASYQRISEWNDKKEAEEKIPLIPTVMAPMTYAGVGYTDLSFLDRILDYFGLPLVIKECHGSFGMQVYLAKTREEVLSYTKRLAGTPFLYQKYLAESAGRDVRLQVVGEKVIAGMYRYSENGDFRANLSIGGGMKSYEPSAEEAALAVRAVKALGLDFAGVDLLFQGDQAAILCEVNSNAHFKNIHTCTGVNTADHIMQYIKEKLSEEKNVCLSDL